MLRSECTEHCSMQTRESVNLQADKQHRFSIPETHPMVHRIQESQARPHGWFPGAYSTAVESEQLGALLCHFLRLHHTVTCVMTPLN